MVKIEAIIKPYVLDKVRQAMADAGVSGMTIYEVKGTGASKHPTGVYRGAEYVVDFIPSVKVEAVVPDEMEEKVTKALLEAARTGKVGDGKIFVFPIGQALRIRTGEQGAKAL